MEKSLGQHLQNWLIRNKMSVTDPLFVNAVDHTIENAIRDSRDVQANLSINKSANTDISRSSCLSTASIAASPNDLPTFG
jgi:hypothetical protein